MCVQFTLFRDFHANLYLFSGKLVLTTQGTLFIVMLFKVSSFKVKAIGLAIYGCK